MRILRYLLALPLIFLSITLVHADGCYVPKIVNGSISTSITEPLQKAAILYMDGTEWLTLSVSYKGNASEFAWLVPTPAKPEINPSIDKLFTALDEASAPKIHYWFDADRTIYRSFHFRGASGSTIAKSSVRVLERLEVGDFDAAVLKANSADDLVKWLSSNGYATSDKISGVLGEYVRRGWVFSALKINTKNKSRDIKEGLLDPVVFEFPTSKMIYPLKVSSLNKGITKVQLYVLTQGRVDGSPLKATYAMPRVKSPNRDHYNWYACKELMYFSTAFSSTASSDSYYDVPDIFLTKLEGELSPERMNKDIILTKSRTNEKIPEKLVSPPFMENLGAVMLLPFSLLGELGLVMMVLPLWMIYSHPLYFLAVVALIGFIIKFIPALRKRVFSFVAAGVILLIVSAILIVNMIGFTLVTPTLIEKFGYGPTGITAAVFYGALAACILRYRKAHHRKQESADRS